MGDIGHRTRSFQTKESVQFRSSSDLVAVPVAGGLGFVTRMREEIGSMNRVEEKALDRAVKALNRAWLYCGSSRESWLLRPRPKSSPRNRKSERFGAEGKTTTAASIDQDDRQDEKAEAKASQNVGGARGARKPHLKRPGSAPPRRIVHTKAPASDVVARAGKRPRRPVSARAVGQQGGRRSRPISAAASKRVSLVFSLLYSIAPLSSFPILLTNGGFRIDSIARRS